MIISMEEEHKTSDYQETIKLDIESIAQNKTKYGDQYMKLFMLYFLKK